MVVQIIDRRRELHLTQQRLAAAAGFGAERRQPHRAGRREPNGAQARPTRAGVRSAAHSPRPAGRPEGRPPLRAARRGSRPQGGSVRGPPPTPVPPELVEFASSCGPGAPRTSTASVNREVRIWARAAVSARKGRRKGLLGTLTGGKKGFSLLKGGKRKGRPAAAPLTVGSARYTTHPRAISSGVEHLPYKQGVAGSNPASPTNDLPDLLMTLWAATGRSSAASRP